MKAYEFINKVSVKDQQGVTEDTQHNSQDLKDVAEWMRTTPDKLNITVKQEPIEKFIKQIREMYGTYDEFPEDEKRTNRILKLLNRGSNPLPMYVEEGDPDLFVMEGRHRMVAFWLAGMKTIPVAYVSVKDQQGVTEGSLREIGFANELDDRNFPKDKLISMGTVDGQIDGKNVMTVSSGNQKVYFLMIDDQMSAFIGFENGYLKNIKNFTDSPGIVRALIGYLVHIKNNPIRISKTEPLTSSGIKWVLNLIKNPRGLVIKDKNGNPADSKSLHKEWLKARTTGKSGNTGLVISEEKEVGDTLRLNESNRRKKSILMPFNLYVPNKVTFLDESFINQGVAEGSDSIPSMGINVRNDGDIDYASLIVDGKKKYESRKTDSLRPYVGKTVAIVRTGSGPATAIGQVTIGEPILVNSKKFDKLRKQHLVPHGSKFDIEFDGTKYLYPMINPKRWHNEKVVQHKGIVARKIKEQGVAEGNIKLFTDPDYFGAEVDDEGFDKLPIVNIPTKNLVGFEPDSKMQEPKAKRNVKKILAGLKSGADIPPILVRKHKGGYQVLDGHHRFWAYKVAKKDTIPARVIDPKDIEEVGKQGVA